MSDDVYAGWDAKKSGADLEEDWNFHFSKYEDAYPELAAEYKRRMSGELPDDWAEKDSKILEESDFTDSDESDSGLKAVVMKRFPADWTVYVDIGDGFVDARGSQPVVDSSDKMFPSPEWIAQRVQTYVEGLPKQ